MVDQPSTLKDDALLDIALLAKQHHITLDEIAQALNAAPAQVQQQSTGALSKLFGYIGGIFVFAGIGVFISMYWDDFGSAARVLVTLGAGFVCLVLGLLCLAEAKYERVATPMFLMAALLQPMGILVMLQEYSSGGDARHGLLLLSAYMFIQQGAFFLAKGRAVLAFFAILFACVFFVNLFDLMDVNENLIGLVLGTSLLCVAYALNQSKHVSIASFWYFVGAVLLLLSVFDSVKNTMIEPLYLGVCALVIFLSTHVRSGVLLLVGALAMLMYIGYYTAEHFANTVGWPVALVMIGMALIGVSALAVKLNSKYIKRD